MKYLNYKSSESMVLSVNEFEKLDTFISVIMYRNKTLGVDLKFDKLSDDHWQINNVAHDPVETVVDILIKKRESGERELNVNYSSVEYVETTGDLKVDDWVALFNRIVGRAVIYAQSKENACTVVGPNAKPVASIDLLGKSYIVYNTTNTIMNGTKEIKVPGEPFVKLASSISNLDDKIIDSIRPVKRMSTWISFGVRPNQKGNYANERGTRMIPEEKFFEEFGVNVSDTTKMWELIESRKIHPLYQIAPDITMCIQASEKITENILAENAINPKFSKSNLLL